MMLGRMHDRGQKVTLKMKMDGRMAGDVEQECHR